MCGRFTLSHREARVLAAELGVSVEALIDYRPRYNIAPTDSHWIVRNRFEDREVLAAKWGPCELLDDGSQAGVQEHQLPRRDHPNSANVSRSVQREAMRDPGRWILRVD